MKKTALWTELILIFVSLPLLVLWGVLPREAIMPMLWIAALYAYLFLRSSGVKVWVFDFERKALYSLLQRFLLLGTLIAVYILYYEPALFLALLIDKPWFWLEVVLLYPLLSAFAQEILFRTFFFHRYEKLFKGRFFFLIMVNALLFAYMHVVFENWIAVIFTFFGGILFAQTYLKTRSTMLAAIEHALYGNTLFTLGLGNYFYHGVPM